MIFKPVCQVTCGEDISTDSVQYVANVSGVITALGILQL